MGHLTRIANNFVSMKEKGPNSDFLNSLFNGMFLQCTLFVVNSGSVQSKCFTNKLHS